MGLYYGWWIVLACFIIAMYVAGAIFYGVTAFVNPLVKEFGWSYAQVSLAASLRGLEMGLFAPIIGILVDRVGTRILLLVGMITVGAGLVLLSFTQSLLTFYAAFLVLSFGAGGCTTVVLMTSGVKWFKKRVGLALGIVFAGYGAGGLLVPLFVKLIDLYQWRTALLIVGVGAWVIGIPLALVVRDNPQKYGLEVDGASPSETKPAMEAAAPRRVLGLGQAFKNRDFMLVLFAEAFRFFIVSSLVMHIMPYLTGQGISRSTAGFIAAGIPLVSIAGRLGFGWLGDLYKKKYVLACSFSFMFVGLLALAYVNIFALLILFMLAFPIGYGGGTTVRGALIREYFGAASFGKLIGITMGVSSLAEIIGPTLTGWV
ncbi:MAG: MFS transporter, partial [Pseudomonadota bacterium]